MPSLKQLRKKDHLHLWELPNSTFPRKGDAKKFLEELGHTISMMTYANEQVQHSALVCSYEIGAITALDKPSMMPRDLFRLINDFAYHYENYCTRVFACREKLLQFLNAILPVGYDNKEVRIKHILINPIIKSAHLVPDIEKFSKGKALQSVMRDRHGITHRLFYGQQFDHYFRPIISNPPKTLAERKKYYREWKKVITQKAKVSNQSTLQILHIANSVSTKVFKYKDLLRNKR